jgi:hypothetical protein
MKSIILPTSELATLREIQPATTEGDRQYPRLVVYRGWTRAVRKIDGGRALLDNPCPSDFAPSTATN